MGFVELIAMPIKPREKGLRKQKKIRYDMK